MMYLVLADRAAPYLLARVRWPDVAQAITVGSPDWLDDPGLFDLSYEPSAVRVSFTQAASIAAGWGRQLRTEPVEGAPSFVRRMPANWSNLSPAERRTWAIESVGRRGPSARRLRRLRSSQAKNRASVFAAAQPNGRVGGTRAGGSNSGGMDGPVANGRGAVADVTGGPTTRPTERRRHMRVRVAGRTHIVCGNATISAGLVDLSEDGMRCVLPEAPTVLASGATLAGPFVLEAEVTTSRICLSVGGRIGWIRHMTGGTHFGVVFQELDDGETEGVQRFLVAAGSQRGSR
jgi:PilZ domain